MFTRNPVFPTLDEILDYYSKYWQGIKEKINIPDSEKDFYHEQGKMLLKKFFVKNQPWNFNILDLESRFEVLIEDHERAENHILAGIIDRIDKPSENSYEIIDYKTSRKMPSQEMIDNNLQLSIYNLGLMKRWPHIKQEQVKLSLIFLEHGEKISSARGPEALEKTKNDVLGTIREISLKEKTNDFPPLPGPWCQWCSYRQLCPMWKHLYQKESAPDENEIKNIVKDYFELKNSVESHNDKIKMLQQKIHQYLDDKGYERVFGEEGYITRRSGEKRTYDMEKVREILLKLGRADEILKADERKLEKIMKNLSPDTQKEINQLVVNVKKTSTLTVSRKKQDVWTEPETI